MMLLKCCSQHVSKFGKASSDRRTERGQVSPQFPRKAVLKSVDTTGQLRSSPVLVRLCSKSCSLPQYVNRELPDVQLGFRKRQRKQRLNCQHSWIIEKAREFQKIIHLCLTSYAKAFDFVVHNCGKLLKR